MSIDITNPAATAGLAASDTDTVVNFPVLITGDNPQVATTDEIVGTDDLAAFTVVGRDVDGTLIAAVAGTTDAIGITVIAGATDDSIPVYRAGVFNPDALVWDASYNTDELKRLAFEAAAPLIFVRAPATATP